MKRFLILMAILCVCGVSVNSVKAVSNAELQDTSRFEHIISKGDTGGGDGKYIELSTLRDISTDARIKSIETKIYVVLPSSNLTYSFANLVTRMPEFKQRFSDFSLNDIWNLKMDDSGIVGTIKAQQDYTLNGESKPTQPGYKGYEHVTFLTPTDFDFESYHVANRVFKKVFGIFYDDVSR